MFERAARSKNIFGPHWACGPARPQGASSQNCRLERRRRTRKIEVVPIPPVELEIANAPSLGALDPYRGRPRDRRAVSAQSVVQTAALRESAGGAADTQAGSGRRLLAGASTPGGPTGSQNRPQPV